MRIAILGPTYPFRGGIAHYTTLLARHLAESHDVALLTYTGQYPQALYPGQTDRDPSRAAVAGRSEPLLSPYRPWTWRRTWRRVAELQPDLFVVQWWVPFWAPSVGTVVDRVSRCTRARRVFVCHNVLPHEGAGAVGRWLVRYALRRGHAFIVHSEADERALVSLLPEVTDGGRRVHRALLPVHAIAAATDRQAARRALGVPEDAPVALFFGFVRGYKGLGVLLDAVPSVLAAGLDLRLVVAGEFWVPVATYERQIAANGITGAVTILNRYIPNEEVGVLFSAADVVVMPYLDASQSGVVTLASQFGLPVIATRVGGLPEAVLDGRTGLIVPPSDTEALSGALVRYFKSAGLADSLRRGVADERERFDWWPLVALLTSLASGPG